MYDAWILSIGNELLIGRVVNTNAAWLARRLTVLGYRVARIVAVPDVPEEIVDVVRTALGRGVRVLISTGGLGPTPDDITAEALALALDRKLELNSEAYEMVRSKYGEGGYAMTPEREKMAWLPRGSRPLPNPVGTAPGIFVEVGRTMLFALPGVPREMEAIYEEHVEPVLRARGPNLHFAERSLRVVGVPEADLSRLIREAMRISDKVYVKSHPKGHEVRGPVVEVHIYASAERREDAEDAVARAEGLLRDALRGHLEDA